MVTKILAIINIIKSIPTIIKEMPGILTIIKKIWHIIKGWWYKIFKEEQDLVDARLPICNACEHRVQTSLGDACGECGCILDAKTRVKEAHCDLGKW